MTGKEQCGAAAMMLLGISKNLICYLLLVASVFQRVKSGTDGELCVVQTPLYTPYIIPYVDTRNPCNGCSFKREKGRKVHVIQTENIIDSVLTLNLDYDITQGVGEHSSNTQAKNDNVTKYVFVISSSQFMPLSIVVNAPPVNNISLDFVIPPEDTLYFYGSCEHSVETKRWAPEEVLVNTKREFGNIASFTRAKSVNRIHFQLTKEEEPSENCSINTGRESALTKCSSMTRKETSGCFHENMLGYGSSDIHILEVDRHSENGSNGVTLLHVTDTEDATLTGGSLSVKRNLTLILGSSTPMVWALKVTNVQGVITVFVEEGSRFENRSYSGVEVSVKRFDLPKAFDAKIITVLTQFGLIVSYTRTEAPDVLQLVVTKKIEPTKVENRAPSIDYSAQRENTINDLKKSVTVDCSNTGVTVTLPMSVVDNVSGGVTMALRDGSCGSYLNGTHLVLSAKFTECGFTAEHFKDHSIYANYAHIDLGSKKHLGFSDDEDFEEGSGYDPDTQVASEVSIKCKTHFNTHQKVFLEKHLKYELDVYRDENLLNKISPKDFPASVPSDSTIYAKVRFQKGFTKSADLKMLIEKCILSSSPHYSTNKVDLIKKSCPVQRFVTINKSFISNNLEFHFVMSLENMPSKTVFLQCDIGVCSKASLPRASLNKCIDPENYCEKLSLMQTFTSHNIASYIDTLVVGPFHIQPTMEEPTKFENSVLANIHKPFGAENRKTEFIVMEGLSTEVVVGIAIASFIIGVCLTATLWIIYVKTDPRRQTLPETVLPRNSGYDLSGHSGSSTPSSQAPMTT